MKLLNESLEKELHKLFKEMRDDVNIILFTKKVDCETCEQTKGFMEELNNTGDKINFIHYDFQENPDQAEKYNVTLTPSIVIENAKEGYKGVKFNGIPAGHEVNSFIASIIEVSGAGDPLPVTILERVQAINKAIHIQVYVTLT